MNKTPYQTELLFQYGIRYSVYKIMDGYNNILISIIQISPAENTNTGERLLGFCFLGRRHFHGNE